MQSALFCTEYPVPCISEARTDICMFIQTSVKVPYIYIHIRMRLCKSFKAFRRRGVLNSYAFCINYHISGGFFQL